MKYILPFLLLLSTIQVSLSQESPSNITKIEAEIKSLKDKLQKYKAQNKAEAEIRAVEIDLENERKVLEWAIDAEEDRKIFKGTTMDYVHKWYTMIKSEFGSTVLIEVFNKIMSDKVYHFEGFLFVETGILHLYAYEPYQYLKKGRKRPKRKLC